MAPSDREVGGREFPWGDSLDGIPRCPAAAHDPDHLQEHEVAHVGVLLVHGVGFQRSGDTFRESVAPLIRLLREAGFEDRDPLADPVRIAAQALPGSDLPFVELDLPRSGGPKREHWAITEAWWAASFEPPSFSTMVGWLGAQGKAAAVAERLQAPRPRTALGPLRSRSRLVSLTLQIVLSVAVTLLLAVYAVLRTIFAIVPIQAVRERLIGSIDRFIQEWAGDMRVLLLDETQAGMVRFRIARSLRALQLYGCSSIVMVAHSGGAVASYMTLTDDRYRGLPVKTFITFGSGLNIAWRLLGLSSQTPPQKARLVGGGLARELPPSVTWRDFWATDDPVPAGPVDDAPSSASTPAVDAMAPRAHGRRVNNRWSSVADHGTYYANDEEFLVPLAEAIDDRVRPPDANRLFDHWPPDQRKAAVARRLERVASLSMWRSWASACGILAIFGAVSTGLVRFWLDLGPGLSRPLEDVTTCVEHGVRAFFGEDFELRTCTVPDPTPAGSVGAGSSTFWLIDALTLTGHIGWILVLAALAYLLLPTLRDWLSAWTRSVLMKVVSWFVSVFVVLVVGFTAISGLPGLLGVSLASSPVWDTSLFTVARHAFEAFFPGLGRLWGSFAMNLSIAVVGLVFSVLILVGASVIVGWSRKRVSGAITTDLALMLLGSWILVSLVFTAAVSGGFRSNLLGWLLILLAFSTINRIGQWRWSQWDDQERWEQRCAIAGLRKTRRAGRRLDAVVFVILAIAALGGAVGIAIRPLSVDVANALVAAAGGTVLLGILVGLAQDEVNGHPDLPGEAPTTVSQTVTAD